MNIFMQGLEVAVWGLAGVFAVLILFYISTKIMLKIFKEK
ncbi:OadG-related small transporter subunit [Peptoniphilus sp.]|nr:OadG-related small transporter subunit [Peptoniphilus sp.]MDD7353503.1 OadG-related small transporter subunit [Peptoniphilaceae bacterium]MDY3902854.1 OadG-related small transporter subunit [Peptoniphilus sp.]